jgi:hypothetical protein
MKRKQKKRLRQQLEAEWTPALTDWLDSAGPEQTEIARLNTARIKRLQVLDAKLEARRVPAGNHNVLVYE